MTLTSSIVDNIIQIAKEGTELCDQYGLIMDRYKKALAKEDVTAFQEITQKHQMAVEAFSLIDQQLNLIARELALTNLSKLTPLINQSDNQELKTRWEKFRSGIKNNQQKNEELSQLLQKLEIQNKQILAILQGGALSSSSAYNNKGKIKTPANGRILGTI